MKKTLFYNALILLALSISACGSNSKSSSSEESIIVDESGFKNVNDTEVFEIQTEQQKEFFSYDGYYATMPAELYPDGTKHLSDSNPITLTWDYEVPEGKEVSNFSIVFGQEKDLSDGYRVDGTDEESISFYNPYLGTNYYKLIATFSDETSE